MGRRNLLLMGAIGMCVCQYIVAIVGTVAGTTDLSAQRAAIAFVCIYIFFFASSWGPVAWVVTGELFPLKVRAKCLSMTTASNWLLNWAIAYSTPYLVDEAHANLQSKVLLHLGNLLLRLHRLRLVPYLRDQGPFTRAGRRIVRYREQSLEEQAIQARSLLSGC